MRAEKDIRLLRILDSINLTLNVLSENYNSLYESCTKIPDSNNNITSAYSKCWTFIDSVHRIREISQSIPGLSGSNINLLIFLKSTKVTEYYRNYIQHLRQELLKKDIDNFPVFGSISWVDSEDNKRCHTVLLGTQIGKQQYSSCVYDIKNNEWLSNVCLSIGNKTYNFDPIYSDTIKFGNFIQPWIENIFHKNIEKRINFPIFTAKIIRKED